MSSQPPACIGAHTPGANPYLGDPVNLVTGEVVDSEVDFRLPKALVPIFWTRFYKHSWLASDRGVGFGFRLRIDVELRFDLDGIRFVDADGTEIAFPAYTSSRRRIARHGYVLESLDRQMARIKTLDGFRYDFQIRAGATRLRPTAIVHENGACANITYDAHERPTAIVHDANTGIALEYEGSHLRRVKLIDAGTGKQHRLVDYEYDSRGYLLSATDPYGHALKYEYDATGNLVRKTDRRGYSFLFTYDADGRCLRTCGEDGLQDFRFEYKPLERTTVVTRGDGGVWTYFYDTAGNILQIVDPYGGARIYEVDDTGKVIAERDPAGNRTVLLYDADGAASRERDPLGYVRDRPDPTPHPLSHELPRSPLEWEAGARVELPEGYPRRRLDLAPEVNATLVVADDGAAPPVVREDVHGLLVREERFDGKVKRYAYEPNGAPRWIQDYDGHTQQFEYASWNLLTAEANALGARTQYGYTFSEQIAAVVDPLGTRSDYKYDLKDRLVEVSRGGKVRERYVYDDADNLIEKQDANGATLLSIDVGPGNLVAERKLPSGDRHRLERDRRGRLTKAECNAGKLSFAYDAWGRRIQDERDGKGVQHRFVGANLVETSVLERFVTRYVYPDATTTIVIDPTGQTQRLRALGPGVAQRSFANGIDEVTQYDLDGKCLAKVSTGHLGRAHAWSKRFEYSGEGDLLARHDSEQGVTRHTHDAAHRLASTVHPDGQVEGYKLDLAGNVLEAPGLVAAVTTANTLHSANGHRFEYNARDHVARRHAPEGVREHRYDSRDQLKAIDGPAVAYRAQHDVLGRRTEKDVNGHKTVFYWDTDRLAAELLPDGKLRIYVYPNESALVPLMFVDYASADAAPESGKRFYLHSDHLGCPERIFDDDARTVWSARIDPYGRARVEVGAEFHQPLRWPGHYYDAETGLHENRFRTYSPELCRYLQSDPLGVAGGVNLYAYTDNPTRAVDLNGLAKSPNCVDGEGEQGGKKRKSEEGPDQEGGAPAPGGNKKGHENAGPPVTSGLGPDVDALVNRSPSLKRQVEALLAKRWTIRYSDSSDGPGSTCNKPNKVIVVDSNLKNHPTYATQTLAHEAGHAEYAAAPYVPPAGKTKQEYVNQNTQRHLDDEGAATLNNARARQEIKSDGGPDIGIAGTQQPRYEAINQDYQSGRISEEDARRQIGDVFADNESTSTTGQTYRDYYSRNYSDYWDQSYPNLPSDGTAP